MAELIEIISVCPRCGNEFTTSKMCETGLDASKWKEEQLLRRKPICPDCYATERLAESRKRAKELKLPQLTGASSKQIAYAFSLRDRYITRNLETINRARMELNRIDMELLTETAEKMLMTEDECIEEAFKRVGLHKEYLCLTETSSRRVIDYLKK